LKLVDDWRDAWKWASMRWSFAGISFNVVAAVLLKGIVVAVSFLGFVSIAWLPVIAAVIALLAMAGRVTKTASDDS
jgi:CHASE2 domain-containing sensor protein